jgi:Flp pilus assembly CpaE family ATPase
MRERNEKAQQEQMQLQQQQIQAQQQAAMQEIQQKDVINQRDNDTKIRVAEINAQAEYLRLGVYAEQNDQKFLEAKAQLERDKLAEDIRQFDAELRTKEQELRDNKEIQLKKIEATKKNKQ